jgi:hypothetical protein
MVLQALREAHHNAHIQLRGRPGKWGHDVDALAKRVLRTIGCHRHQRSDIEETEQMGMIQEFRDSAGGKENSAESC